MWQVIFFLIMLGIGLPILAIIYDTFTNTTNGSWLNWTTSNATPSTPSGTYTVNTTMYSTYELGWFQILPILVTLMGLAFLLILISGYFKKTEDTTRRM